MEYKELSGSERQKTEKFCGYRTQTHVEW